MKSSLAMVAVVMTAAIAGCDRRAETPASDTPIVPPQAAAAPVAPVAPATPVVDDLPKFAVVYPDAEVEGDPLLAGGAAGPGGVVTFVTDAQPDAVIAFYRERAEAAGLATMMSLNQGGARAYGAQQQATGASVNVVAAPSEAKTSVQLTWSAGH